MHGCIANITWVHGCYALDTITPVCDDKHPDRMQPWSKAMLQVIFQVYGNGKWMDYCREQSPETISEGVSTASAINVTNGWAKGHCERLGREQGKPFRYVIEVW